MKLRETKGYVSVTCLTTNTTQNGQTENRPEKASSKPTQVLGRTCGLARDVWENLLKELGVEGAAPESEAFLHTLPGAANSMFSNTRSTWTTRRDPTHSGATIPR